MERSNINSGSILNERRINAKFHILGRNAQLLRVYNACSYSEGSVPNGLRKKSETKLLPMVIATFTPYFAFVLGVAIFLSMAYYGFDADKIEARLEKRR